MDLNEQKAKRARLIAESRDILNEAAKEKRDLTAADNERFDKLMADADAIAATVVREERIAAVEATLGRPAPVRAGGTGGGAPPMVEDDDEEDDSEERMAPPALVLRQAERVARSMTGYERQVRRIAGKKREPLRAGAQRAFLRGGKALLTGEQVRALQTDSDIAGGFLRPDQQFVAQLIKNIDDFTYIRQLATVILLDKAESLGYPVLDNNPADADWTSELATGSEDSTMTFGKRELRPHPLAKRIKVSKKLLRQGSIDVDALVRDRLGYKFGITGEKAYMTGNGAEQPLGVFTASANGISTARDASTGNTTTAVGADGLIDAKYSLKPQYWPRARWIFHRDALKQIRKLKDGDGQYLWSNGIGEGLTGGSPDMIQGLPVLLSEYAPNTFTTGLYVGILGDFSRYMIVDALDMTVEVLDQLYAETNQMGYIARMETDGMPVLEESFVRVKLA